MIWDLHNFSDQLWCRNPKGVATESLNWSKVIYLPTRLALWGPINAPHIPPIEKIDTAIGHINVSNLLIPLWKSFNIYK